MTSNQRSIESDIPGFYYDSEKKKYYRITPAHTSNPLHPEKIRRLEGHRESVRTQAELRKARTVSIPKAVGLLQGAGSSRRSVQSFQSSVLASTMAQLATKFTSKVDEHLDAYVVRDALASVSAGGNICSAFSMKSGGSVVVASAMQFAEKSMRHAVSNAFNKHKVVDLKAATIAGGQFAAQACQALLRSPHFVSIRPLFQDMRLDDHSKTFEFPSHETMWSLAVSPTHVAVGMERLVRLFTVEESRASSVPVPNENVFVLESDADGNDLFAGTNKGNVHLIDVRSQKIESTVKLGAPLSNLKVSDRHLLVAGYDHTLMLFDKRSAGKPLAVFGEYANDCRPHLTLQLHENLKLAAASGSDNVVRLWSLTDFKLMSTLSDGEYKCADSPPCFVIDDSWGPACTVAVVSESTFYCYA